MHRTNIKFLFHVRVQESRIKSCFHLPRLYCLCYLWYAGVYNSLDYYWKAVLLNRVSHS